VRLLDEMNKMRFRIAVFILVIPTAVQAQVQDTQVWITAGMSAPITGRLSGGVELSLRTGDNNARLSTTFVRPTLTYKMSKAVTLKAGYVRVAVNSAGSQPVRENRVFEEVNWSLGSALGASWGSRTQIEQRFIEGRRDTGWRLRERIKLTVPLRRGGLNVVASSEWIFALNSTDYGAHAGFDQTRNFVGINVPLDKHASVEAGYMNRYAVRRGGADRDDHIVPVTLSYRF
jgi:hypothetical protein